MDDFQEMSKLDAAGQRSPWALVFDLRERETEWSDANQARSVSCT